MTTSVDSILLEAETALEETHVAILAREVKRLRERPDADALQKLLNDAYRKGNQDAHAAKDVCAEIPSGRAHMAPERLAEIAELAKYCTLDVGGAIRELLGHIIQLEAQVARGGAVVVAELTEYDMVRAAGPYCINDREPFQRGARWAYALAVSRIQPIPASQALQPGMAGVRQEYIDALESAANQFCGTCRDKPTCSLGMMAIGKGCGAWRLDAVRINALRRAQQSKGEE